MPFGLFVYCISNAMISKSIQKINSLCAYNVIKWMLLYLNIFLSTYAIWIWGHDIPFRTKMVCHSFSAYCSHDVCVWMYFLISVDLQYVRILYFGFFCCAFPFRSSLFPQEKKKCSADQADD